MPSKLERQMLQLADDALRATEKGRVEWRPTTKQPPEYYAHFPGGDDLAVRRYLSERPSPSHEETWDSDEYAVELVSPETGVLASLSSERYHRDSEEYATLRALFEAARADAEGYDERIERLRRVLQEQT